MSGNLVTRLKKISLLAVGNPEEFSLESRIFHSFSLLALIILPFEIVFNLLINLPVSAALTLVIFIVQIYTYYLSRIKNWLNIAVIISSIEINIFIAINYFFNAGLAGSTLLIFAISLFMVMSVSQKKHWIIWLLVNLFLAVEIVALEYYFPWTIKIGYDTRSEMFMDNIGSYIIVIIILYVGTTSIRNNYQRQKQLADEKTLTLEMLNAEKDKLFSIISHDLRSPLALTQQYFSALKEVELDNEDRVAMEKELFKNITNAQELLTNLLNWAKNQMERAAPQLNYISLKPLLTKTSDVFTPIALKKNIQLNTIMDEDITVKADTDMLQLIVRNLLNNAIKFTSPGGAIELKAVKTGTECIISVKDNGIGIPKNKQQSIFSLSVNSTYGTENEKGTGLGLVLCKDYTQLQNGKIWFTSNEDSGTTFFVSLPCLVE